MVHVVPVATRPSLAALRIVRVTITGANGFDRAMAFAADAEPAAITEMVRATLDE
jgi:hypothetical protein